VSSAPTSNVGPSPPLSLLLPVVGAEVVDAPDDSIAVPSLVSADVSDGAVVDPESASAVASS
jgi:hypothetical protein